MNLKYTKSPLDVIKRTHPEAVYAAYKIVPSYPHYGDDEKFYLRPESKKFVGVAEKSRSLISQEECDATAWGELSEVSQSNEKRYKKQKILQPIEVLRSFGYNEVAWTLAKTGNDCEIGKNLYSVSTLRSHPYLISFFEQEDFKRFDDIDELLDMLSTDELLSPFNDDSNLAFLLTKNVNTPRNVLNKLLKRIPYVDYEEDEEYGSSFDMKEEEFEALTAISLHPNAPLEQIAQYYDEELLDQMADSRETPPRLLDLLAKVGYGQAVVGNLNTSSDSLEFLAKDKELKIRLAVAKHRHVSIATLEKLSKDWSYYVRQSVAENLITPLELLQKLAGDEKANVRRGVAHNKNAPLELLELLSKDEDHDVRQVATRNPNFSLERGA